MKKELSTLTLRLMAVGIALSILLVSSSFRPTDKIRIGFLVHDLVSERWKMDMENFANKIEALGGEAILKNAYGDARTQIEQGKMLVDEGVKVLVVVAQDGMALAELVDYANQAGAKVIAYDRMISNSQLPYYISFNSVTVGELMAEYALNLRPTGNYVLLNGPSSDNNALLVRQGVMNKLKPAMDKGQIKIILEKELSSWYSLNALMAMDEFITTNQQPIDAVIASSDDLAAGALDAIKSAKLKIPVLTGQDATVDACKNIILGNQSMTVFKSIKKLSSEAAMLAMKVAKGEKIEGTTKINNGKWDVPSVLFNPVAVNKTNMQQTVIAEGQIKVADLK